MKLDNQKIYKKLDSGKVADSIELLADQIRQVLYEARLIKIPKDYSKANQVVINGMGGSNLGARVVKTVMSEQINLPISITPGYLIPASIGENTIYIISSYSGNTEEPLSVYREVKKRGAKVLALTSANGKNKLADLMIKEDLPGYIFKPEYNPSGQPRLGVGYMVFGTMVLLAKAGLFKMDVGDIEDIVASLEIWDRRLRPLVGFKNNIAKQIASRLYGREIVIVGAEFLNGNIHVLRNQICETSKNFASYLSLPDLNHFAMEGLSNPKNNKKNLVFLFFDSSFYHSRIQKRAVLTKEIIKKNKINIVSHELCGKTKMAQAFEVLQLGNWISYYLGVLNNVDPSKTPWVDWFKKELKQ